MLFEFVDFYLINTWIELFVVFAFYFIAVYILIHFKPTRRLFALANGLFVLLFISYVLMLTFVFYVVIAAIIITFTIFFISNMNYRKMSFFKGNWFVNRNSNKVTTSTIYDTNAVVKEIFDLVSFCSKKKIGAIIVFETKDDLSSFAKSGTQINAPVSSELLQTIFYPGTRLHDGAVIIKENKILAASVYFTPTTKALTGKYGSRHRAAIGISEVTDSVTVIVSEETGIVSFAIDGVIESTTLENFSNLLEGYLKDRKQ